MKITRLLSALVLAATAFAQQPKNVQKTSDGTNAITESLVIGNGKTLSASGTGTITATSVNGTSATLSGNATINGSAYFNGGYAEVQIASPSDGLYFKTGSTLKEAITFANSRAYFSLGAGSANGFVFNTNSTPTAFMISDAGAGTFAGNLTVSGGSTSGQAFFNSAGSYGFIQLTDAGSTAGNALIGTGAMAAGASVGDVTIRQNNDSKAFLVSGVNNNWFKVTSSAATVGGNLTVSGTGTSSFGGNLVLGGSGASGGIGIGGTAFTNGDFQLRYSGVGLDLNTLAVSRFISFSINSVEAGRFAATSGNLLLGTTTDAGQKLQVAGNLYVNNSSATHTVAQFSQSNASYNCDLNLAHVSAASSALISRRASGELWMYTTGADAIKCYTNSTLALTLSGSDQSATFAGSIYSPTAAMIASGTTTSTGYNNNANVQVEGPSGRAIVNHTNGTASGAIYAGFGYNGSGLGSVTQSGTSGVLYNTTSDARLKTNIRDVTNSGAIIDALKPRVFDWKTGDKDSYGFIAQEVYQVFPQAVKKGDDGQEITDAWAMDAAKLVPVLVAEIKALRARVQALESK